MSEWYTISSSYAVHRYSILQAHCAEAVPSPSHLRLPPSSSPIEDLLPGQCFIYCDLGFLETHEGNLWIDGMFVRYHHHPTHTSSEGFTPAMVTAMQLLEDNKLWITSMTFQGAAGVGNDRFEHPAAVLAAFGAKVYVEGATQKAPKGAQKVTDGA